MKELDGLPFICFILFFFLYSGKFYCHTASQFTIRFECKRYQSIDIPPLVYLGFFPPSEMIFVLFILSVVPGNVFMLR